MFSFKAFCEERIYNILEDFVEDFDPESLQVGLWSGSIHLSDVTLKGGMHSWDVGQGMTITLEYGHVEEADLQVPWTSLHNGCIKGDLENVSLVFRAHVSEEDDEARAFRESLLHKMKLVRVSTFLFLTTNSEYESGRGLETNELSYILK